MNKVSHDINEINNELTIYIKNLKKELREVIDPYIKNYPPSTRIRILRNFSIQE